jgi:hypothetical protein
MTKYVEFVILSEAKDLGFNSILLVNNRIMPHAGGKIHSSLPGKNGTIYLRIAHIPSTPFYIPEAL